MNGPNLEGSKVDYTVQIGMGLKDFVKRLLVGDIDLSKLRPLPTDQFNAIQGLDRGIIQVISDDNLVTGFEQGQGRKRPNVSRSALAGMARTRQLSAFKTLQRCQIAIAYPVTRTDPVGMLLLLLLLFFHFWLYYYYYSSFRRCSIGHQRLTERVLSVWNRTKEKQETEKRKETQKKKKVDERETRNGENK